MDGLNLAYLTAPTQRPCATGEAAGTAARDEAWRSDWRARGKQIARTTQLMAEIKNQAARRAERWRELVAKYPEFFAEFPEFL